MHLINLLSWLPGHSGFGSYVQRVVPGLDGLRLQLGCAGQGGLLTPEQWTPQRAAKKRQCAAFCSTRQRVYIRGAI